MTVILCFVFDTGYCLMDANGYLVCANWFDTEEAAVEIGRASCRERVYHPV